MISLRPRGEHAPLRRAAARLGAGVVALSPWALLDCGDAAASDALRRALAAPRVLFTSPAAVRAAHRLQPLDVVANHAGAATTWLAVGAGTRAALLRAGVITVIAPDRMDSEGLLALPELTDVASIAIGLVTAPGGRGTLAPALRERGAEVVRADVYQRVPVAPSPRALATLRALREPAVLAVSSEQALRVVLGAVPDDVLERLRTVPVVASSERLADVARGLGFGPVEIARSARPGDLVAEAARIHAEAGVARPRDPR